MKETPYRNREIEKAVIAACYLVGVQPQETEEAITRWYHNGAPEPCSTGKRSKPGKTCRCRGCIQLAVAQMCNIAKHHFYGGK